MPRKLRKKVGLASLCSGQAAKGKGALKLMTLNKSVCYLPEGFLKTRAGKPGAKAGLLVLQKYESELRLSDDLLKILSLGSLCLRHL